MSTQHTSTPSAVGPFCKLPSGRVVGAEYINGDPATSVPHAWGCECHRCITGKPVDVDAVLAQRKALVAALRELHDDLTAWMSEHDDEPLAQHIAHSYNEAGAALAAAEGES